MTTWMCAKCRKPLEDETDIDRPHCQYCYGTMLVKRRNMKVKTVVTE